MRAKVWLDDYFTGKNPDPSRLTLVPYGTAFRESLESLSTNSLWGDNDLWRNCRKKLTVVRRKPLVKL